VRMLKIHWTTQDFRHGVENVASILALIAGLVAFISYISTGSSIHLIASLLAFIYIRIGAMRRALEGFKKHHKTLEAQFRTLCVVLAADDEDEREPDKVD